MIIIIFYDVNGCYVCTHSIEFEDGCYFELGEVDDYVARIFQYFENAGQAYIFYRGNVKTIWRNE